MTVPSPVPAGTEREAMEGQAAAKALWESLPLGTSVFVQFMGSGPPRQSRRTDIGWESDDDRTRVGCTPWSVRVDEVWIPAALAAVVSSSPATPERCRFCAKPKGDHWPGDAHDWTPAPSPASPAETREDAMTANLGLATTRELLDELRARIEVDHASGGGGLDYTTVDGRLAASPAVSLPGEQPGGALVPDAAVEAAHATWTTSDAFGTEMWRECLEAAAPFIIAAALPVERAAEEEKP